MAKKRSAGTGSNKSDINYSEIDPNLHKLCKILNHFEAVRTIGSCGGHENPEKGQWPLGSWYVKTMIEKNRLGWLTIEFLGWAINHDARSAHVVIFYPDSFPPYLNKPGQMLTFNLEGNKTDPDDIAEFLDKVFPYFIER